MSTLLESRSSEGSEPADDIADETAEVASRRFEPDPRPTLEPGTSFGRYLVIDELGAGGMGVVLRAYDPVLHREVALKALKPGRLTNEMRARLVREARAMAKLSHSNVVAVHDVEVEGDTVVLVMEYVQGGTLKSWQKKHAQSAREIVALYLQAGRGLAAAHRAGLLHRDFKPSNVLVSPEGVVKVTDFGLARAAVPVDDGEAEAPGTGSGPSPSQDSLASLGQLTRDGVIMGTPDFMAPEQIMGEEVGPEVDQYAFCVALWGALNGKRPFDRQLRTWREKLAAKKAGPPPWPRSSSVPRQWAEAIRRGLRADPRERWPSLDALLAELARDPRRRRNRWLVAGAAVAVVGFGAGGWSGAMRGREAPCTAAAEKLAGIWDIQRAQQVERAFSTVAKPYADRALAAVKEDLDTYAAEWTSMHTQACEATTIRGEQSTAVMDLRMACLHRVRTELGATVEQLATADADVVENAHDLTASLPPVSRCADIEALSEGVEPPMPEEAPHVDDVRVSLARAGALIKTGDYEEARSAVGRARAALEGLEYRPVRAEVALRDGQVLEKLGEFGEAESALSDAFAWAAAERQWDEMQRATTSLARVVGYEQRRMEEGLRYAALAEGLARKEPLRDADVAHSRGTIYLAQGKYDEAEAELRRALEIRARHLDPDHPDLLSVMNNLGGVLLSKGDYTEAEAVFRRTLDLEIATLGPDHPDVALPQSNLAGVLHGRGKYEEAEVGFRRALEIREAALGPDHVSLAAIRLNIGTALQEQGRHAEAEAEYRWALEHARKALGSEHPHVVMARNNLAVALETQGKYDEAIEQQREALELAEKVQGGDHPNVASSLNNLAAVLLKQGNFADAEAAYRRSLEIREASLGADHPHTAQSCNSLANVLIERGAHAEAETLLRRALTTREKALGDDHPDVAKSRSDLARLLLARRRPEEALTLAEAAWERGHGDAIDSGDEAETSFVLARALWATDPEPGARRRARKLAERALELFAFADPPDADAVARVRDWLDAHDAR